MLDLALLIVLLEFNALLLHYSPNIHTDRATTIGHTSISEMKPSPIAFVKSKSIDDITMDKRISSAKASNELVKDTDHQSSCSGNSLSNSLGSNRQSQESLNDKYSTDQDITITKSNAGHDSEKENSTCDQNEPNAES